MNVFDANCWCEYVTETLYGAPGVGCKIFEIAAESAGGILMDDGGIARQQYISMKRPYAEELYNVWAEAGTTKGWLKLIDLSGKDAMHKPLKALGLPKSEHIFFRIAVHGAANYIISLDIDFFDPTKKKADSKSKQKAMASGLGPVCKAMKKSYGISICCPAKYLELVVANENAGGSSSAA